MKRTIYEFRPIDGFFVGGFRRYAGGQWIPDDGEYDLAFIGRARGDSECVGYPCCLYVQVPGQNNIVCSWLTKNWTDNESAHGSGNPWHYALRDGESEWGGTPEDYWNNANRLAGDSGSSEMCKESGCCNGRSVEFKPNDPHIRAGLLRDAETKEPFSWPENMRCMYCGAIPPLTESHIAEEKQRVHKSAISQKRSEMERIKRELEALEASTPMESGQRGTPNDKST